jgi:hypothetical protein
MYLQQRITLFTLALFFFIVYIISTYLTFHFKVILLAKNVFWCLCSVPPLLLLPRLQYCDYSVSYTLQVITLNRLLLYSLLFQNHHFTYCEKPVSILIKLTNWSFYNWSHKLNANITSTHIHYIVKLRVITLGSFLP